jgi:hypothetical protein
VQFSLLQVWLVVFKEYQIFIIVAAFMNSGEYHAVQMTGMWDVGWQSFGYEKMLLLCGLYATELRITPRERLGALKRAF